MVEMKFQGSDRSGYILAGDLAVGGVAYTNEDQSDWLNYMTNARGASPTFEQAKTACMNSVRESLGIAELEDEILANWRVMHNGSYVCVFCGGDAESFKKPEHGTDCIVRKIEERRAVREGGEL